MFAEEANQCPGKWSSCTPATAPCSPARHGSGHSLTAGVSVLASSKAPFPGSLLSLAHRVSLHYRRHSRSPGDSRATPEVSKMHFRSSSPVCSGQGCTLRLTFPGAFAQQGVLQPTPCSAPHTVSPPQTPPGPHTLSVPSSPPARTRPAAPLLTPHLVTLTVKSPCVPMTQGVRHRLTQNRIPRSNHINDHGDDSHWVLQKMGSGQRQRLTGHFYLKGETDVSF